MIPTLIGITFLVFMLVAMSPGGIGAALGAAGGQMEASKRAQLEAYLEDRYGLNDPVTTQYVRWLGRISPVKFGTRDQVTPARERVRPPKTVREPLLWRWYAESLPETPAVPAVSLADLDEDQKALAYRKASGEYASARAAYVSASALLEQAMARFAKAADAPEAVTPKNRVRPGVLRSRAPAREGPEWEAARKQGLAAVEAYAAAQAARARLAAVFAARPYPEAGVAIIPGVLSVATPDLGVSFSRGRAVSDLIGQQLPVTLMINFIAFPIIYMVAIPGGMLAAVKRGSTVDVLSGMLFVALWSVPAVWAGTLAIGFLANQQYVGAFPVSGIHESGSETWTFLPTWERGSFQRGYLLDTLWHLALPVLCLVYGGFAILAKQTRAAMLDNFNADYVRTAKAKGVSEKDIVFRHVFRNSLLPLITMFVTIFPAMLAGSVVIEKIFTVPGMGSLLLEAINLRDRELILANTLMIAAVNLLALLLADILYAVADPRISYE